MSIIAFLVTLGPLIFFSGMNTFFKLICVLFIAGTLVIFIKIFMSCLI